MLAMGAQVAAAIAIPLLVAALAGVAIDTRLGSAPWGLLAAILAGLVVAGSGVFLLVRAYLAANPIGPTSDQARAAGRRWEGEIAERERRREAGEEE